MSSMVTTLNTAILSMGKLLREDPKSSQHKEKNQFFLSLLFVSLRDDGY